MYSSHVPLLHPSPFLKKPYKATLKAREGRKLELSDAILTSTDKAIHWENLGTKSNWYLLNFSALKIGGIDCAKETASSSRVKFVSLTLGVGGSWHTGTEPAYLDIYTVCIYTHIYSTSTSFRMGFNILMKYILFHPLETMWIHKQLQF